MSLRQRIRQSQLWKSIVRQPLPDDRRGRIQVILANLFLHVHPTSIPRHALRPGYTWYMGLICCYLFAVETVTGVLLMFYYRPTTQNAYQDMLNLRDVTSLGVLREMHRWAAHALVIAVLLHLFRVFLTGSYKRPREFNWCVGVVLLVLTLLLSYTGYLLPWDQLALWAVTVGANIARSTPLVGHEGPLHPWLTAGGTPLVTATTDVRYLMLGAQSVGEETLVRFYVLHCVALPLVAAAFIAVHIWRVRKDGGISGPGDEWTKAKQSNISA